MYATLKNGGFRTKAYLNSGFISTTAQVFDRVRVSHSEQRIIKRFFVENEPITSLPLTTETLTKMLQYLLDGTLYYVVPSNFASEAQGMMFRNQHNLQLHVCQADTDSQKKQQFLFVKIRNQGHPYKVLQLSFDKTAEIFDKFMRILYNVYRSYM